MMEVMTGMDSDERLWEARLVADVRAGVRLAENVRLLCRLFLA